MVDDLTIAAFESENPRGVRTKGSRIALPIVPAAATDYCPLKPDEHVAVVRAATVSTRLPVALRALVPAARANQQVLSERQK